MTVVDETHQPYVRDQRYCHKHCAILFGIKVIMARGHGVLSTIKDWLVIEKRMVKCHNRAQLAMHAVIL